MNAVLEIDLDAVAANTRLLAARATGELMAVVKADGFGHGAADVARTALAHGATRLGVTGIGEALALRAEGVGAPILSWLNTLDADVSGAVRHRVELAVPSHEHLDAICRAPRPVPAAIHLHLDVGMARDGASPTQWAALCRAAARAQRRGDVRVVGLMGHLGCADPDDLCTRQGRTRFAWALEIARGAGLRPRHRHLAATAATLTDPLAHHTMSRVGAGLVGIDPSGTTPLHAAATLRTSLVSVREVPAGTVVGYGHDHRTARATRLGLVPLGYADGLPRAASDRAHVLVAGHRCPVVGLVSMDQLVVDLGRREVSPGAPVTVFGTGERGEPTLAEWAAWSGTLPHEIVTGLGLRTARLVLPARHAYGVGA